ncbi:MAG TPA: ATP-binding protein [Tepidisphaeraceae bacterium]|nr:ATP-binding protein [Tepidisphaeraceae bacterium]
MSIRRKMGLQIGAMLVGLVLISTAALWGLNGLHENYELALGGYNELREVYGHVGYRLATAVELLQSFPEDRVRAAEEVERAADRFDMFLESVGGTPDPRDQQAETQMRAALAAAVTQLRTPDAFDLLERRVQARADVDAVNAAIWQLRDLTGRVGQVISERQHAADVKRRDTILALSIICAIILTGALVLGVLQYRSVLLPLNRLMVGVRKIAAGEFKQRLDEHDTEEFDALAKEFNRMAAELDEFYHRLEQKVEDKSRELIRSERLASVGYLAAGVAHEINNPLGIIAGYAEYTLSQLKAKGGSEATQELEKSLHVICDEAFRCKEIIGKLLSLARPGEANRREVDLGKVAQDVASAVVGLRDFHDRKLVVTASDSEPLVVNAVEAEMKQIVLNLTVNALEAVPSGGEVRVDVARNDGWVALRVRDNGRGMSSETLQQVFEPFFTDKRGSRQPGTGLGLSITHAIVESHGGRIRASSGGLGQGSEFVVELPAAAAEHKESSVT